jgi:integrase/recombinase XerD
MQHRSSILRILDKYVIRAGLDPISPHMLRHTFATRYLGANPDDIRGLARLLGHASLNTVMIYTEPHLDDLAERMERADLS